jgi:hypothetical protein
VEDVLGVLLQVGEDRLRVRDVAHDHVAVVGLLVELDVVLDDLAVAVFASRGVPRHADHVGRLEPVRDVGGGSGRGSFGCVHVLYGFLPDPDVVLTGDAELVFDAALQVVDAVGVGVGSCTKPIINGSDVGRTFTFQIDVLQFVVLHSVPQPVAFQLSVGLRRPRPLQLDGDGGLALDYP